MKVDGKVYDFDLIITPDGIKTDWWRQDGHHLHWEDLEEIFDMALANLVIGSGANGRMTVTENLKTRLSKHGFDVTSAKTDRTVDIYNGKSSPKIGAFHLTC